MAELIKPHGGTLVNRVVPAFERQEVAASLRGLKAVSLNARTLSDLELIAVGAFSPLEGFMGLEDYRRVVHEMRLATGLPWSIPITLAVDADGARDLKDGQPVALLDPAGEPVGVLHLEEKFPYDKAEEAWNVYGTYDERHPGVQYLMQRGEVLLGGKVDLLRRTALPGFEEYKLDPADTRASFARRGWRTIVGFQTRNPIHRSHEYIQKCALELMDGFLLHPLVGKTKLDDVPSQVRMRCYQVLLTEYYPRDRVLLAAFPGAMRYAGPREAVFHALVRKNYGCTHFIVGRDHAGVGDFYAPYAAREIFQRFAPEEVGIVPLFFEETFFCKRCDAIASSKTCPHAPEERVALSGTKVREILARGGALPEEFTRPEVAEVLREWAAAETPEALQP